MAAAAAVAGCARGGYSLMLPERPTERD